MTLCGIWGERPIEGPLPVWYLPSMNLIVLVLVLLLLFGGGGFYYGGPVYGGSGIGLILLVCLVIYLFGGFRTKS